MDDIAKTANLSKGTLYLYFKNKEELFNAISERNTNELKNHYQNYFKIAILTLFLVSKTFMKILMTKDTECFLKHC